MELAGESKVAKQGIAKEVKGRGKNKKSLVT